MYTLHVNVPGRVEGSRVYIPGLGTYDNGSTNDVSEVVAQRAFTKYPRLYGAVDGTDIVVGNKPEQVEDATEVEMVSLTLPFEENE